MIRLPCACGQSVDYPQAAPMQPVRCACSQLIRPALNMAEQRPARFTGRLIVRNGPSLKGEHILLGGETPIELGKLPGKAILLNGPNVSRNHGRLLCRNGQWWIEDAQSTNGTYVDGNRTQRAPLDDGSVIDIGDFELAFQAICPAPISTADDEPILLDDPMEEEPVLLDPVDEVEPIDDSPGSLYDMAASFNTTRSVPSSVGRSSDARGYTARSPVAGPPVICPSCARTFSPGTKICVDCGIYTGTGKPLVMSKGLDEDELAHRADIWIRVLCWIIPFGLYPVASEAYGTRKPYTVWAITVLTILCSLIFLVSSMVSEDEGHSIQSLMLWAGDPEVPNLAAIELGIEVDGEFAWYQLITHALLHGGIMHLAGNLLFLLVFGTRVNELIGNLWAAIVYPVLAVLAAVTHMIATADGPLHPMLGASGAIMGLAGMYFVFFPVNKVRMAIWFHGYFLTAFKVFYKLWSMRGFWLLGLLILLQDVLPTMLDAEDGTAHWAHLGGFASGMLIALILLVARQANSRGSDILSVTLGRGAWALIGKPSQWKQPDPPPRAVPVPAYPSGVDQM